MIWELDATFRRLIGQVAAMGEVLSIGRSGGSRPLPASAADGDIDVFAYCASIPNEETRSDAIMAAGGGIVCDKVAVFSGGRWGTGDLVHICGIETWLMYMTDSEATEEVDFILTGCEPDRQSNYFYPTGRLAMLQGMEILCDKTGFLSGLQSRLSVYPDELAAKLAEHHLQKLRDTEDLERAVARKDVLFYHFALDLALDHFLQALFAVNKVYFPSRKRSLEYIRRFAVKPDDCEQRLLEIVSLGVNPDGIARSFNLFTELVSDLDP